MNNEKRFAGIRVKQIRQEGGFVGTLADYFQNLNWWGLLGLVISAASSLFCITIHELSHGFAAYRLGDPTAKSAGRLTLNPIKHIDPLGLIMMVTVHVGWAKPVPVDMRWFKHPKRDMAVTALAGPVSNFVLAFLAVWLSSMLMKLLYYVELSRAAGIAVLILLSFLANTALLSVGLGVFNLIPLPPLDGSKILFSFLPDRIYHTILRYERYVMLLVILLAMSHAFSTPLTWAINAVMEAYCSVTKYSYDTILFAAYLMRT